MLSKCYIPTLSTVSPLINPGRNYKALFYSALSLYSSNCSRNCSYFSLRNINGITKEKSSNFKQHKSWLLSYLEAFYMYKVDYFTELISPQ